MDGNGGCVGGIHPWSAGYRQPAACGQPGHVAPARAPDAGLCQVEACGEMARICCGRILGALGVLFFSDKYSLSLYLFLTGGVAGGVWPRLDGCALPPVA